MRSRNIVGTRSRANYRYGLIRKRLRTSDQKRNRCYAGVQLLVDQKSFVEWFMARDFLGASVDRIDPTGHYELSNMQVIPTLQNMAKSRKRRAVSASVAKEVRIAEGSYRQIAEKFKISQNVVRRIKAGHYYRDVA